MTISPKKYVSHFTSSTTNRGVEAKEIEIANTHLDMNTSNSTQDHTEEGSMGDHVHAASTETENASHITSPPTGDETHSYIKVVVQKHRKKRESTAATAAQTSPRLPTASSPIKTGNEPTKQESCISNPNNRYMVGPEGDGAAVYLVTQPLLLTTAAPGSRHPQFTWASEGGARLLDAAGRPGSVGKQSPAPRPAAHGDTLAATACKESFWKRISKVSEDDIDPNEYGPARLEVLRLDTGSLPYLVAAADGPHAAAERWAARAERGAARLLAELLAVPRCLVMLPVLLLLQLQRSLWVVTRTLVAGSLAACGDLLLKPLLAGALNALVAPSLACAGAALQAARRALQPLAGALHDLLAPVARVLSAVRLVHVSHVAHV